MFKAPNRRQTVLFACLATILASTMSTGHGLFPAGDTGDFGNGLAIGVLLGLSLMGLLRMRRERC
ncbi:hypothetical protein GCM10023219_07570 [Stakelama sediminis]|uniref:Uncharacterized protein n=1 Tax=Stakelama sediminis TaxID=463200 RepID=A0A840YV06_9SPHN|nr:hypothetical protein [Stakelama sediminis]MBB5717478.1 hypothetical protein [Stakelama sediminis]